MKQEFIDFLHDCKEVENYIQALGYMIIETNLQYRIGKMQYIINQWGESNDFEFRFIILDDSKLALDLKVFKN